MGPRPRPRARPVISGWRRICSWRPISRLARMDELCPLDRGRPRSGLGGSGRTLAVGSAGRSAALRVGGLPRTGPAPPDRRTDRAPVRRRNGRTRGLSRRRPGGSPGDGRARAIQGRGRIDDLPHGGRAGRRTGWSPRTAGPRPERHSPPGPPPATPERLLQAAPEILLPDRAPGLFRCPGRVRTPVGERAEAAEVAADSS